MTLPAGNERVTSGVKKLAMIGGACILLWVLAPFAIVPAGTRGVMTTFGKVSLEVLEEGIHFRIPIAQRVHLVDVQVQKGEGQGDAASMDLQTIHTTVALNYHIDPNEVVRVFREIGLDVGSRIVVPAVQESVKAATATYTAEQLISKRPEVKEKIRSHLAERLHKFGLVVDEFSITNFDFSKSFNESIEAKATAEQLRMKAERDLARIKIEAEQKVASARAEAESLALQKAQISTDLIRLRETENQREAIKKWDGKLPTMVTGGSMPFINITPGK